VKLILIVPFVGNLVMNLKIVILDALDARFLIIVKGISGLKMMAKVVEIKIQQTFQRKRMLNSYFMRETS